MSGDMPQTRSQTTRLSNIGKKNRDDSPVYSANNWAKGGGPRKDPCVPPKIIKNVGRNQPKPWHPYLCALVYFLLFLLAAFLVWSLIWWIPWNNMFGSSCCKKDTISKQEAQKMIKEAIAKHDKEKAINATATATSECNRKRYPKYSIFGFPLFSADAPSHSADSSRKPCKNECSTNAHI